MISVESVVKTKAVVPLFGGVEGVGVVGRGSDLDESLTLGVRDHATDLGVKGAFDYLHTVLILINLVSYTVQYVQ